VQKTPHHMARLLSNQICPTQTQQQRTLHNYSRSANRFQK